MHALPQLATGRSLIPTPFGDCLGEGTWGSCTRAHVARAACSLTGGGAQLRHHCSTRRATQLVRWRIPAVRFELRERGNWRSVADRYWSLVGGSGCGVEVAGEERSSKGAGRPTVAAQGHLRGCLGSYN
eukprot:scaffold36_cov397-Prasinococcus_capsulatus_cf.AAC.5